MFQTFVAQTETQLRAGELRLQKMLFMVQPMLHIMSVLAHIAQAVNNVSLGYTYVLKVFRNAIYGILYDLSVIVFIINPNISLIKIFVSVLYLHDT